MVGVGKRVEESDRGRVRVLVVASRDGITASRVVHW
jgi:hypothetical protein